MAPEQKPSNDQKPNDPFAISQALRDLFETVSYDGAPLSPEQYLTEETDYDPDDEDEDEPNQ